MDAEPAAANKRLDHQGSYLTTVQPVSFSNFTLSFENAPSFPIPDLTLKRPRLRQPNTTHHPPNHTCTRNTSVSLREHPNRARLKTRTTLAPLSAELNLAMRPKLAILPPRSYHIRFKA